MPLGTFIAGRYSALYDGLSLGIMSDGYEMSVSPKEQVINRSDAFGDMMIDTVLRGSDWFCQYEAMEAFLDGVLFGAHPSGNGVLGVVGVIGRLGSDVATDLVLTATAGTPAAVSPATLTANFAKVAPNSEPRFSMNSMLRLLPTRLQLYPYDAGSGVIKHFVTTE